MASGNDLVVIGGGGGGSGGGGNNNDAGDQGNHHLDIGSGGGSGGGTPHQQEQYKIDLALRTGSLEDIRHLLAAVKRMANDYPANNFDGWINTLETRLQKLTTLTNVEHLENERDADGKEFNWSFAYLPPPPPGLDLSAFTHRNIPASKYATFHIKHDVNKWMAGGSLYDAPRAGNVLFNVIGDLNTTRFLGLEDKNFSPELNKVFANPEVFRILNVTAGGTSSKQENHHYMTHSSHTDYYDTLPTIPKHGVEDKQKDQFLRWEDDINKTVDKAIRDIGDTLGDVFGW